jgi:hypothetical protein
MLLNCQIFRRISEILFSFWLSTSSLAAIFDIFDVWVSACFILPLFLFVFGYLMQEGLDMKSVFYFGMWDDGMAMDINLVGFWCLLSFEDEEARQGNALFLSHDSLEAGGDACDFVVKTFLSLCLYLHF